MKKIIYIIIVLVSTTVYSQSVDQNWVKTTVYKKAFTEANLPTNPTAQQASVQVNYFDGLGRPIQSISHQQSATGKDIIQHIEYDAIGRQTREYLPFTNGSTSLNYQAIDSTDVQGFYTPTNGYYAADNPYSEKQYEASPLNRVLKQAAPGNAWAMGSGHEIKLDYQSNSANEVRQYDITTSYQASTKIYQTSLPVATNYYGENQLYKSITIDENNSQTSGNQTEEFTDKQGQVVLKRIKTNGGSETFDTYYIYDDYGNLSYVLPPAVDTNQTISQSVLDGTSYQYKYDHRNRLVAKKIPSKQWEYIVYDKLDRVRATAPAKSPFKDKTTTGWLITKYDNFNRPILTAWQEATTINDSTRIALENSINAATKLSESKSAQDRSINNISFRYTNASYPIANYHILTVNYYDNYNYPNAPTVPSTILGQTVRTNNKCKTLATGAWVRILENSTDTNANTSYSFYKDDRLASVIGSTIHYPNGGYTKTETAINFEGQATQSITTHKRDINGLPVVNEDNFTYTAQGRLLSNSHKVNNNTEENIVINNYKELGELERKDVGHTAANPLQNVDYRYNIRGWLTNINEIDGIAYDNDLFAFSITYNTPENATNALYNGNISETYWQSNSDNMIRKYDYTYDDLNRLKKARSQNLDLNMYDTYNEELTYDKNGNIQSLQRNGGFENASYGIMIDNLTYIYDPNNLNQLKKVVDLTNSSQGFKDDSLGSLATDTSDDYSYDLDGNMTKDENKNITNIKYNHLNLPTEIQFTNSRKINYTYDATGIKLKKKVQFSSNTSNTITTDYLDGYQYETQPTNYGGRGYAQLLHFPTAEGYVKAVYETDINNTQPVYQYVYNYTDHLGNIRMSYTLDQKTGLPVKLEETHYYPFGLKHSKYNDGKKKLSIMQDPNLSGGKKVTAVPSTDGAWKYRYQGQELQDELGLNWYDYQARNYDPAIGRWMNIDPLSEMSRRYSPYTYALDNPVYFIDPDGMLAEGNDWIKNDDGTYTAEKDDSAWSLHTQHGVDAKAANDAIESQLGKNYIGKDGGLKSDVKVGDIVKIGGAANGNKTTIESGNNESDTNITNSNNSDWDSITFWGYGSENTGRGRGTKSGSDWSMDDLPIPGSTSGNKGGRYEKIYKAIRGFLSNGLKVSKSQESSTKETPKMDTIQIRDLQGDIITTPTKNGVSRAHPFKDTIVTSKNKRKIFDENIKKNIQSLQNNH